MISTKTDKNTKSMKTGTCSACFKPGLDLKMNHHNTDSSIMWIGTKTYSLQFFNKYNYTVTALQCCLIISILKKNKAKLI